MGRVLQFTGGVNPWDDIHKFVAIARKKYPGISDRGINQIVMKTVMAYEAPTHRIRTLYGRDILTADLEQIPAWSWLPEGEKARLAAHPYSGGAQLDEGNVAVAKQEEAGKLDRGSINRLALVTPGLERTYVFADYTPVPWTQEVTEGDYHRIMQSSERRFFIDPDLHGPYTPTRAYDAYPAIERHSGDKADLKHFVDEHTRKPKFSGVDVA